MVNRRHTSVALLTLLFLGCLVAPCQVGPTPPAGLEMAGKAIPPSDSAFQALFNRGEASLQALPSECQTREDWALLKALKYELSALKSTVGTLPKDWTMDQIKESMNGGLGPRERAMVLAAYRIATATPQWETRNDPKGRTVFFQGSAELADSEWNLGVRIPSIDVEAQPVPRKVRDFCMDVEAFRSAFAQVFQSLGKEEADQASARSDAFIAKVFNRQFPWEAWINTHWAPGTLTEPSHHQYILGHLHGGLLLATQGKVTATPSVLLEVIGWEQLTSEYDQGWGLSAAYAPRLRPEERDGGGVLFHLGSQSFGVVWKAEAGQGRTAHLVYSVALGKWLAGPR